MSRPFHHGLLGAAQAASWSRTWGVHFLKTKQLLGQWEKELGAFWARRNRTG